jgi:serine/threonine-protein kinase
VAKTPRPSTDHGIGIGQVFLGKYRVEEILGQGGMGIVARCTHLALNEQVAIKMLRHDVLMDEDAKSRFMREAQAAVKLRSEYVARVTDVGTFENGVPFMVMEYLDGHDLGALLEEQGCVAVQWATDLMLQACEALAEAHSIGIVHRDVKPTNLFVTWRPDGSSLIKVLDFGISKSPMGTDMQLTQTQSLLGTPAYMSPEQMRSARLVDGRSDIWSLGTVMYELLEGHRPFEAESFSEMCVKVAVDPPAPMNNTPPALQHVVLRCLAKSPEQRYPTMADLGRDLVPFARDPHAAQMMVERMFRTLGRATPPVWEGPPVSTATRAPMHSAPVRAATPMPSMQHDAMPTLKKKRSGMVIGIVAGLCIAAGGVALYATSRGEEPETKTESKAATTDPPAPAPKEDPPAKVDPTPTPTPPTPTPPAPQDDEKVTEPKPDPTEAKVADEGHKAQTKKAQSKKAQSKKGTTPTVEKTVKPTEPDPKSDRDKLAEPQPGGKVDVYANPRPKPRAN